MRDEKREREFNGIIVLVIVRGRPECVYFLFLLIDFILFYWSLVSLMCEGECLSPWPFNSQSLQVEGKEYDELVCK